MARDKAPVPCRDPLETTLRVRMLPDDFYRLSRVATAKKKTKSDIARDALDIYIARAERELGLR